MNARSDGSYVIGDMVIPPAEEDLTECTTNIKVEDAGVARFIAEQMGLVPYMELNVHDNDICWRASFTSEGAAIRFRNAFAEKAIPCENCDDGIVTSLYDDPEVCRHCSESTWLPVERCHKGHAGMLRDIDGVDGCIVCDDLESV